MSQTQAVEGTAVSPVVVEQAVQAEKAKETAAKKGSSKAAKESEPEVVTLPGFLTPKQVELCKMPMPSSALSKANRGLTSIKTIYIAERLNQIFGEGRWYTTDEIIDKKILKKPNGDDGNTMVVVKTYLHLIDFPEFLGNAYGGHDNGDYGDSFKGAVSDALGKIAATHFGIAADVYKGQGEEVSKQYEQEQAKASRAAAASQPKEASKEQRAEETRKAQETVANPPKCDDCSGEIKSIEVKGKRYDPADLIKSSQTKYQKNLCGDCLSKRAQALKQANNRVN